MRTVYFVLEPPLVLPRPRRLAALPGSSGITGTGSVEFVGPALAASGAETFDASGAVAFAGPALAASGAETFTGTAAVSFGALALAGSGETGQPITGTGAIAFGVPGLLGSQQLVLDVVHLVGTYTRSKSVTATYVRVDEYVGTYAA